MIIQVLNGDALLQQMPAEIPGERIVMRESLVDGDVSGESPEEFYETRAEFIGEHYGSADLYYEKSVPELEKIRLLHAESEINLWFEDDLFCQVNLWYVLFILPENGTPWLVRPEKLTSYGFAAYDQDGLKELYKNRQRLVQLTLWKELWPAYRKNDIGRMMEIAGELSATYPFLQPAVKAHLERIPSMGNPGRPALVLQQIMQELGTQEFGPVFREFNRRESIYGFGDDQVFRIFKSLRNTE